MSEAQVTTLNVQQGVKQGDKPSASTANELAEATRQELSLARQKQRANIDGSRPYLVNNTGGEDIPAYSPAEIVGIQADKITMEVDRPTAVSLPPSLVLFTKANSIVAGEDGFMYSTFDVPLESQTAAAGVLGSGYGTQADSFELIVDGTGFICTGTGVNEAIMRPASSPLPIDVDGPADGDMLIYDNATGTWIAASTDQKTMVTDMRYDSTSKQLQKKTLAVTVINPGTESAWTIITGGQAVEET